MSINLIHHSFSSIRYYLNPHIISQVLAELKEYATEVDVDFVRKAVRAIGRCAIKVEPSAEKCVTTLLELIQTKVNYVVQEAIVVIKVCVELQALSAAVVFQVNCRLKVM